MQKLPEHFVIYADPVALKKPVWTVKHRVQFYKAYAVAVSSDGRLLATANIRSKKPLLLKLYDLQQHEELDAFEPGQYVRRLAFLPDGRLCAPRKPIELTMWDTRDDDKVLPSKEIEASRRTVIMRAPQTPFNRYVLGGNRSGPTLYVMTFLEQEIAQQKTWVLFPDRVIAASADGGVAASVLSNGDVFVWPIKVEALSSGRKQ